MPSSSELSNVLNIILYLQVVDTCEFVSCGDLHYSMWSTAFGIYINSLNLYYVCDKIAVSYKIGK